MCSSHLGWIWAMPCYLDFCLTKFTDFSLRLPDSSPALHCLIISSVLIDLHWLPICFRIQYKLMLLTYRAINGLALPYITDLLCWYAPSHSGLRSANKALLFAPKSSPSREIAPFQLLLCAYGTHFQTISTDPLQLNHLNQILKTYLLQLAHNQD